ncbi:L-type lectin-domain containing receptor kinase IX.1 [Triticum urartu]|uniref:L-type lectin-domain containing receptor kinase IX.1 n=1 Tax=Triticum urartu TaxID=4572 RepID=M7ZPN8_TRIUA|nr:L-type lectin-domain containing receptor kinase IX.1 [Triticum urartu]
MARARSSGLPSLFLFFCFYFCSTSSIYANSAVSLPFDFSHPTAILMFPEHASITATASARPGRSRAHSTARVSYAKRVQPWESPTGKMVSFATNFSFQIIAGLHSHSSSCTGDATPFSFTPTMPHGHGQNLGFLLSQNSTTDWYWYTGQRLACFSPETEDRSSKLIAIGVRSTEGTGTSFSPSKNLPSALLPRVSYLAPHAAELSFNCSGSYHHRDKFLGINTTELCDPVFFVFLQEQQKSFAFSAGSLGGVGFHNLTGCRITRGASFYLLDMRSKRPRQSTARSNQLEDVEHVIREPELRRALGPREFRYSELAAATDNFAEERKIGRGGFGPVYRGYLTGQNRHVAIKMLSEDQSVQGLKEFQAEVTVMSQLRHRNIVHLVGWCGRRRELALAYELMPGGSLDTHLYNPDRTITWSERYKIALGLGFALRYLHTECEQCVVHGDIKPANVMLDASRNVKLGDFGLARLVDHGAEPQTTQVVAGTVGYIVIVGYIDPEFINGHGPSAESDVYSFGVVLLEIACGRRPTSRGPGQASAALLAAVREMYRRNQILDATDRRLDGDSDGLQMERLLVTGLWCTHHDPVRRPSVTQAVDVLRSEDARLPVLEAVRGSGEIHFLEGQAYGDLPAEDSAYLHESTETAYLSATED